MKYDTLKALVNAKVYENTEQEITGGDMNNVLQSAIASLGAHYQMGGLVSPNDKITVGDEPVVFLATTPGTYTYFGGLVVADGEVALLVWSGTAWSKQTPDIATGTEVSQLGQKVDGNNYEDGVYISDSKLAEIANPDYVLSVAIPVVAGDKIVWHYGAVATNSIRAGIYNPLGVLYGGWKNSDVNERTFTVGHEATEGTSLRFSFAKAYLSESYVIKNGITVWTPGKVGLETNVNRLDKEAVSAPVSISKLTEYNGIISSGNRWVSTSGKCVFLPVAAGERLKIVSNSTANIALLTESGVGTPDSIPAFAQGFNSRIVIPSGESYDINVPSNATALYIRTVDSNGGDMRPNVYGGLSRLGYKVSDIETEVADLAEEISTIALVGEGDTYVSQRIQLVPGLEYTVLLANPDVSMEGVTSPYARFAVDAYNEAGTRIERCVLVNTGNALADSYLITVPEECAYLLVGCRCAADESFLVKTVVGDVRGTEVDTDRLLVGTFNSSFNDTDTAIVREKVGSIINGKDNIETFLFFTDPHLTPNSRYETMTELIRDKFISTLQKYYNSLPMDTCICGGDWLNFNHSNEEAAGWLGYCDGYMRKLFRNYLPVFGNHDNNPYNPNTSASNWLKALTYVDIRNLMFRENKMSYYSHEAVNTRFYVLNSGVSFIKGMTDSTYSRLVSNRWPQVDWLGQKLLSEDPTHAVIVMHIYSNASNESDWFSDATGYWAKGIHAFGANVKAMAIAYNNRQPILLNGNTYDFSNCEGQIAFIMCGHTHFDYVDTSGELPIVCCTNLEGGYLDSGSIKYTLTPTFDNCVVDYDNGVLYAIRVGAAKNRIIHFVPQSVSVGSTIELTTELTGTVTWESRDTLKATVSNGSVTGVASGIVGIKATDDTTEEYWIIKVS